MDQKFILFVRAQTQTQTQGWNSKQMVDLQCISLSLWRKFDFDYSESFESMMFRTVVFDHSLQLHETSMEKFKVESFGDTILRTIKGERERAKGRERKGEKDREKEINQLDLPQFNWFILVGGIFICFLDYYV